ncbi:MAG TPA: AAA family ATPase [Candidatus Limnocylindrales bacterium]|nr:AAA family ATPase [Candidatus Limnocylindrales bacterium]
MPALAAHSRLEIRVLGPLEVHVDGQPLRVDTRKASAILALLAVERRPYARDELAALFWPESDDDSARGALRRTLSVLKAALGDRWLHVDRSTVSLSAHGDGVWLDLAALEAGASSGDQRALAEAAALARGPFLAGFSLRDSPDFDDWRATRAVTVERRIVEVLERLVTVAEETGDAAAAIAAAMRVVELDPLDEPARRRLMVALARGGDRAAAIREYRTTVAILERELGVVPLAATTELYEAIRDERLGPLAVPVPEPPPVQSAAPAASVEPRVRLPMLGRRRELDSLREACRRLSPDGRVASVTGEAGIGKSRLVETALAMAEADGATVLAARAFPSEGSIPYAPIVELLRAGFAQPGAARRLADLAPATRAEVERLVPLPPGVPTGIAAAGPADAPASRVRLLEAIATVLKALVHDPVPGIVAVEDLQWADDASREALLYLARRLAGRPMLLLLTWRPADLEGGAQAFADTVLDLPGVVAVRLERLDDVVVGALVDAAVAAGLPAWDAAALAAESEGLPLYVVEALMAGPGVTGHVLPRGVRALLRERLVNVSETAGQVLATAAVIGRSFDFATVRASSGRSDDETVTSLEELVRRGIVRELTSGREPAFDFGHARLRDAAYEDIGLARRRLLHRRVAEVLRADPAGRTDPGRLAQIAGHEQAAGRDAAAAEAYREAGLGSRRVYAHREALEHLETALALGHPDVVGLQVSIGEIRTAQGDYAGAIASLEAAAGIADEAALAAVELRLGQVHARRGDVAAAVSHLDAALAGAGERLRPTVLVERGAVALRAGDLDLAATLAGEALSGVADTADGRTTGAARRLLGLVALRRGDLDAARASLRTAVDAAGPGPESDPVAAIAARNGLALVEAAAGDHGAAIALLEAALAECRRTGETHLEAAVENNLADQLHAAGRAEEAMGHLKRAVVLFADVGGRPGELEPEIWKLVSW